MSFKKGGFESKHREITKFFIDKLNQSLGRMYVFKEGTGDLGVRQREKQRGREREKIYLGRFTRIVRVFVHVYNDITSPFWARRLLFDLFIKKRTEDPQAGSIYVTFYL